MKESAVSTGVSEGTADYSRLLDKTGKTLCALRPSGIVEIDGKNTTSLPKTNLSTPIRK